MTPIRVPMDNETRMAAKKQAKREGMLFSSWIVRLVRRTLGLSDEVPPVHEISLEDRLKASVSKGENS
jgi:hypothetical protein